MDGYLTKGDEWVVAQVVGDWSNRQDLGSYLLMGMIVGRVLKGRLVT